MKNLNRRHFVSLSILGTASMICQSCLRKKEKDDSGTAERMAAIEKIDPNEGMSRPEILAMLDRRVERYISQSGNCAQSSFKALSEQFGLENEAILKALTPMPGIAETGKTCGVVIGSLMVMGLIYGRDNLDDWKKYRDSLEPTGKFVRQFEEIFGSSMCGDIVEKEFGKRLNLRDPGDRQEFLEGDPAVKCGIVAKKGVEIAANIILDYDRDRNLNP
jgi:C_GCAxxG_C_C family probable redox protein